VSTLKGFDKNSNNLQQDDWSSAYLKKNKWKNPNSGKKRGNLYRFVIVLLILAAFFALRGTSTPWGAQIRENLRYVLTTEWDYQPVFEKVVQYGMQIADADWPFFSSPRPVVSMVNDGPPGGFLPLPVSGKVVRNFGLVVDPIDDMERFHAGIDIAAPPGSTVKAVQDGEVKKVADNPELGQYVLIDHGQGTFTLYGKLNDIEVREGGMIKAGETIGKVGSNGLVDEGCLHFELRENKRLVDPLSRLQIKQ